VTSGEQHTPGGYTWRPRPGWGLAAATVLLAATTVGALRLHGSAGAGVGLSSVVLVYLVAVVIVAVLGGTWPGIVAAVASDALLNWYFIPPYHTLSVEHRENLTALIVYILVAVTVSVLVNTAAAQRAAAVRAGLEAQRLAAQAARAQQLAEVDRLRTAILRAVGHDLRTPLAGIKAAASSLHSPDVQFTDDDRHELVATIVESADRLSDLIENLLALSRLQSGVLSVQVRPVAIDEVVARAALGFDAARLVIEVPDDLPWVRADPGLLERVVANLIDNAVRATADGGVCLRAAAGDGTVGLSVVDHGPGIPEAERERVFAPFQRLDDHSAEGRLGLGLAIARGFTDAMGGQLYPAQTPGGGLTMTVVLVAA
jgi:two-component system sensor histidine kinase KdpD